MQVDAGDRNAGPVIVHRSLNLALDFGDYFATAFGQNKVHIAAAYDPALDAFSQLFQRGFSVLDIKQIVLGVIDLVLHR